MLELDVAFSAFLDRVYDDLPDEQKQHFVTLLDESDTVLQAWLMGQDSPPDTETRALISLIQNSAAPD